MRTETFPLNYLYMQRQGLSVTSVSAGRISDNNSSGNSSSSSNSGSSSNESFSGAGDGNGSQETNGTFIRSETKTDFWGSYKKP